MSYASLTDLETYGLPAVALAGLTTDQKLGALASTAAFMDSKFRGRYALPLIAWGLEVTRANAILAAEELLNVRGSVPADENFSNRLAQTYIWLDQVQRSAAHPDVTPQPAQTPNYQSPKVLTASAIATGSSLTGTTRGW